MAVQRTVFSADNSVFPALPEMAILDDSHDLAEQLSNPVASLISVPFQDNHDQNVGVDAGHKHQINIQPVIPMSLGAGRNMISRTILTFGVNTESNYHWTTDEWSVPLNVNVSKLTEIGDQVVSLEAGVRHWADSPEAGPGGVGERAVVTSPCRNANNRVHQSTSGGDQ